MSRVLVSSLLLFLMTTSAIAQPGPSDPPQIDLILTLTTGNFSYDIHFGLDVRATDGYDAQSGLAEDGNLPPFGPSLEARFVRVGVNNSETVRDYRFGDGQDQVVTHYFKLKKSDTDNTNEVTISWNLPAYVTGSLSDANVPNGTTISSMSGSGSTTIANNVAGEPIFDFIKMDLSYENIPDGLLPVELTLFDALVQNGRAILRWETASELNNAGFEVQQRIGGGFQAIGFVEGRGTTSEKQTYSFRTRALAAGRHDFRLKQIDFDGTFAFSPVASANIAFVGAAVMEAAHPNPFNPQTQFSLTIAQEQKVTLHVYDMLGRQVKTLYQGILAPSEAHRFTLEADNLPSGRYFIRAIGEFFTQSQTVTLLK